MRTYLLPILLTSILTTLFYGCASSTAGTGAAGESKQFASTTISDSSSERIDRAIRAVFEDNGFQFVSKQANTYRFTKRGDKKTEILYGSTWSTDYMSIEPEVTVEDVGMGKSKLSCEVNIVEHTTNKSTRGTRHQLIRRGKQAYNDMLERVKKRAED